MSSPARRIVIGARPASKGDNGNAVYMARMRSEKEQRRRISSLLIKWERGFRLEDAPPDCNEWTRDPRPCSNGPSEIDR